MFTTLHTAKKVGAISFEWSATSVIVSGLTHIVGPSEFLAVCLVETTGEGDYYRTEIEHTLAIELGIVLEPTVTRWLPEELR